MSFVFASSHLPEVERPDHDEEEEEDVQPMQRSGMVRAFSHLPQPVRAGPAAPRSSSPAPASRPAWAAAPEAPAGHEADDGHGSSSSSHEPEDSRPWYLPRITAADLQPEGGGHDDADSGSAGRAPKKWEPEHDPDPGFDGTPPKEWGNPTRDAGFDASPQDVHDAPDTTGATPAPRSAALPYGRLFEKRPTPGFSAPTGGPQNLLKDYAQPVAEIRGAAAPELHFTPAISGQKRDAGPSSPQSIIPSDLDWANANPQKRGESLFPSTAERKMTEQERSLAEIGENVNPDSLHELHEWNKAINEGSPMEDKPRPNPPLLPRRVSSSGPATADQKQAPPAKLSGLPPAFTGPVAPGQKRVSESEMSDHLANILNHAKISDFDKGGKYCDQRYVETAHGPVDLKHVVAAGSLPLAGLTVGPATLVWEAGQKFLGYPQSSFAKEDLISNTIGARGSDASSPEWMSGKTFGDESARLIGNLGVTSLPYGR